MAAGASKCTQCGSKLGPFDTKCPACGFDPEEWEELLRPGAVIAGRYEVVAKLGAGGMGMVYKAAQRPLGTEVCVKTLHKSIVADDPTFMTRFEREARVLAGLRHPNIVSILDFGADPRAGTFFVMELVEGDDLRAVLKREGPMRAERAARILGQVCDALTLAHGKGVIHRDLKPSNIMVCNIPGQPDFVKVLDFGSALILGDDPQDRLTRAGVVIGTPIYMAPEYILGRTIDGRVDVYAVAVMLYYLLCGSPPFKGVAQVLFAQHVQERPPTPKERNPDADVTPELERVVMRGLEKDPDARFESAAAFKAAMNSALVARSADLPVVEVAIDDEGPEWDEAEVTPAEAPGPERHVAAIVVRGALGLPPAAAERVSLLGRARGGLVEIGPNGVALAVVFSADRRLATAEAVRLAATAAREAGHAVQIGLHVAPLPGAGQPEGLREGAVAPVLARAEALAATAQPGQILVTEPTAQSLSDGGALRPSAPPPGLGESVFDVSSAETSGQSRPRLGFVGRDAERRALLDVAMAAASGRVCLLTGVQGVGKSRLVDEVTLDADRAGVLWSVVPASPRRRRGFSHPAALLAAHGLRGRGDDSSLTSPVTQLLMGRADTTSQTGIIGRVAQDRLVTAAVAWLVDRVPEGPVTIVLDDLQEADDLTLALARRLVEMAGTIGAGVVLVARDEADLPIALPDAAVRLRIDPLTPGEILALATGAFPGATPAEAERLAELSAGVPGVLEALVAVVARGDWRAAEVVRGGGPAASLRALQRALIGALDPAARGLLFSAATLGFETSEGELRETTHGVDLSVPLSTLVGEGLLAREFGSRIRFATPSLWRTATSMVGPEERARYHEAAARAIAASEGAELRAMELGEHLFEARDWRGSLSALRRAAAQAEGDGELREAVYALRMAVEAAGQLGPAHAKASLPLHRDLGRLYLELRDFKRAEAELEAGIETARALDASAEESEMRRLHGRAAVMAGDLGTGRSRIDEALRIAVSARATLAAANAAADLADTDERLGQVGAASASIQMGLELTRGAADDAALRSRMRLLKRAGRVASRLRDHGQAIAVLGEAAEIAERLGERYELAGLLGNLGSSYARLNDMARAAELTERARRESGNLGDLVGVSRQTYNMALIHFRSSRVPEARDLLVQSRALALRAGWREGVSMCDAALGRMGSRIEGG